ncbi:DUF2249 domain-containing protein [Rhizobium sp. SEMIA 4085]|uniref:Sulfurtransferase TusA-like protein n=1 Tax=Rhizobium gallicum bv. gallicum R602sp TaxID=1041138 RepID=A0A0B4XI68_9HYPH|nr:MULTISPECIES: DUF2249 domain-containing protein [Rhizobium]AJD46127.1 sulfurtransferase TusA-like protein [Rhizobium gallicum bv. gallicum R602sp]NNH29172.1 DUF2249 domain-containing protein [Rhizobium sp. SEMIA 4085]
MSPVRELDVRQLLKDGGMPFQVIMETVQSLHPDESLRLRVIFEPVPLIRQLSERGYSHRSTKLAEDNWEILFTPQAAATAPATDDIDTPASDAWPEPEWNLDLTDLAPPEPMERILARLETMKPGEVLFALLAREPVFLFNELKRRGHEWAGNFDASGSTYRIMIRVNPSARVA